MGRFLASPALRQSRKNSRRNAVCTHPVDTDRRFVRGITYDAAVVGAARQRERELLVLPGIADVAQLWHVSY